MNTDIDAAKAEFAKRLNEAMDAEGYKVRGRARILSKKFDVSDKGAGKWIKAEAIPETAKIPLIADFLHINTEWLMSGKGSMRPSEAAQQNSVRSVPETYKVINRPTAATIINKIRELEADRRLTPDLLNTIDNVINLINKNP